MWPAQREQLLNIFTLFVHLKHNLLQLLRELYFYPVSITESNYEDKIFVVSIYLENVSRTVKS